MKRIIASMVSALALLAGCASMGSQDWITLLDGEKGMENWNITGGGNWRAEDGSIQADKTSTKGASVLVSKRTFKDFELKLQVKLTGKGSFEAAAVTVSRGGVNPPM
jgi:hypothetical protein